MGIRTEKAEKLLKLKDGRTAVLREFRLEDKEALISMYADLSPQALRWSLPPYDREKIERWISNLANSVTLIACSSSRVVGHLYIFQLLPSRLRGIGELLIYLHQDFHGLGLGTAMMKEGIQEARKKGLHRLGLTVVSDNHSAIRVYEKVGFQHEGVRREDYFGEDGRYHDTVEMGLIL